MPAQPETRQFKHEPLNLTQAGNIRLIRLQSMSHNHRLRCSMMGNLSIYDTDYSAVSYEWGDSTAPRRNILINGKIFSIQQNLHRFLHSLVAQGCTEHLLWVDAVCIDQRSPLEKNHQVAQMGQIYQNASNVLIWLGPAADGSDQVFDFIEGLDIPVRDSLSSVASFHALTEDDWSEARFRMDDVSLSWISPLLTDAKRAVCNRTYWIRQWVLQEVLLARNAVFFCGLKQCRWLPFLVAMEAGWNPTLSSRDRHSGLPDCLALPMLKGWTDRMEASAPESLQALLLRYRSCRCTDPRDKIYALLSLAGSAAIPVDYGFAPGEVLSDAFETFEDPLDPTELNNLLESVSVSLDEFLACYAQRRKHPIKQVVIDVRRRRHASPFMTYNLMSSHPQSAVDHKKGVRPPSPGLQASARSHGQNRSTEFFAFRHFLQPGEPEYILSARGLGRRGYILADVGTLAYLVQNDFKVCECAACKQDRHKFFQLSNYHNRYTDQDLDKRDHYFWSSPLDTMYFLHPIDSSDSLEARRWVYCGSAIFRDGARGYAAPLWWKDNGTIRKDRDKDVSIFLYWDPTLCNVIFNKDEGLTYRGMLTTGQMQRALLYHNHSISAQERGWLRSPGSTSASGIRDVRIGPSSSFRDSPMSPASGTSHGQDNSLVRLAARLGFAI